MNNYTKGFTSGFFICLCLFLFSGFSNNKPVEERDLLQKLNKIEEKIDFNTVDVKISDELKEYLKSGVEAPYSIKGNGTIWLQTKGKYSIEE